MTRRALGSGMLYTSKPRSASHGSWQRRRFTKSAATVDGEYDPDLALAIQESLKQAELDASKANERDNDSESKIHLELFKENNKTFPKNMANHGLSSNCGTKHLKDLVCVNMDLIQQQQDVINQRNKTIKSLRAENSALQCRLQRMERRMALLKQKEDVTGSHSPPPKPGTMSYTEPIFTPSERTQHKRKLDMTPLPSRRSSLVQPKDATASKSSSTPTHPHSLSKNSKNRTRDAHRKRKSMSSSSVQTSVTENDTIETNDLYYVSYYPPVSDEIEVDSREQLLSGAKSIREIEVPTFRIKTYTNLYVIEGTEDHEDETFLRRHQKPEIEEKRRKRWDNQRMRDEKMVEKLREKQDANCKHGKPGDPVESFYPVLDEVTHVEVLDKIPVIAFGKPIPYTKAETFSLPWTPKQQVSTRSSRHK